MGSLLVILGWWWLLLSACFLVTIIIAKKIVSIASIILTGVFLLILGIIWQTIWHIPILCYLWLPASALIIFWAHRENIDNLKHGKEKPLPNIFARSKKPGPWDLILRPFFLELFMIKRLRGHLAPRRKAKLPTGQAAYP